MEPSYSFFADLLAKFQTSSDWIKTLWIVAFSLTVVGLALCLSRMVTKLAALFARRGDWQGDVLYAIYRAPDGRWLVYAKGKVKDLIAEDCPEPSTVLAPFRPH